MDASCREDVIDGRSKVVVTNFQAASPLFVVKIQLKEGFLRALLSTSIWRPLSFKTGEGANLKFSAPFVCVRCVSVVSIAESLLTTEA